jgi:hypothetical protein
VLRESLVKRREGSRLRQKLEANPNPGSRQPAHLTGPSPHLCGARGPDPERVRGTPHPTSRAHLDLTRL